MSDLMYQIKIDEWSDNVMLSGGWLLSAMYHDLNGSALSSLGSLEGIKGLLQRVVVSYEWLDVHPTTGHHLQSSRIAAR